MRIDGAFRREQDRHPGALALAAVHLQLAAMQLDERIGDRQAEPGALIGPGQRLLDLAERREHLDQVLLGDADAVVDDLDGDRSVAVDAGGDLDPAALGRELDGVRQQVQQHLHDPALVAPEPGQRGGDIDAQADRGRFRRIGDQVLGGLDDVAQLDVGFLQLDVPRHGLGQVQDVVDDVEQVPAAGMDVAGVFQVFGRAQRAEHLLLEDLREPQDGVQGRPQLVAHIGQELVLGPVGQLGLMDGDLQLALGAVALGDVAQDRRQHPLAIGPMGGDRRLDLEAGAVLAPAHHRAPQRRGWARVALGVELGRQPLLQDPRLGRQQHPEVTADDLMRRVLEQPLGPLVE